jgi:hypothetical protein
VIERMANIVKNDYHRAHTVADMVCENHSLVLAID